MPVIDSFPEVSAGDLTGTDVLYVRRPVQASGQRDAKFALPQSFRSFLGLAIVSDRLIYGSDANTLSLTTFTSLARSLLSRATAPLMREDLGVITGTATLNFASINAAASEELTITVTGAAVGDAVFLGLPAAPAAGIVFNAFVSAADTVKVRASNITGSPVNPDSATYRAVVIKSA